MNWQEIWHLLNQHRGKALGILLGLIFGWFAITYGVLKAIFVALCAGAGFYIGRQFDHRSRESGFFSGWLKDK